jgi:hypothetical protein
MSIPSLTGPEAQSSGRIFIIPSSMTVLTPDYFAPFSHVELMAFQSHSRVCSLDRGTFRYCTALRSIRIPPSVEVLGGYCFVNPTDSSSVSPLEEISFEPGSRLKTIGGHAFDGCLSLTSICLPASVTQFAGASLWRCGVRHISIEPGNRHFRITDSFVWDIENRVLVRYLGTDTNIEIPDEIEGIDDSCFSDRESLSTVSFGTSSKLQWIGHWAFWHCCGMKSLSFPSSLTFLGESCFRGCSSLSMITFGVNSHLVKIHMAAFEHCTELISIDLPSSIEVIGHSAFASCAKLSTFTFPRDSKLTRIKRFTFADCSSLTSLTVPSSVGLVQCFAFETCDSLTDFRFETPCQVRELLDLPPRWTGIHDIPDCVEVFSFSPNLDEQCDSALIFGRDSKLCQVDVSPPVDPSNISGPCRTFLQVSTPSLKRFRSILEFGSFDSHRDLEMF